MSVSVECPCLRCEQFRATTGTKPAPHGVTRAELDALKRDLATVARVLDGVPGKASILEPDDRALTRIAESRGE